MNHSSLFSDIFISKQILIHYMFVINWSILSVARSHCSHRFFSLPCDIFWWCSSCRWCGKPLGSYLVPYWKMPVLSAVYCYSKSLFVYLYCREKSIDWLERRFAFSFLRVLMMSAEDADGARMFFLMRILPGI